MYIAALGLPVFPIGLFCFDYFSFVYQTSHYNVFSLLLPCITNGRVDGAFVLESDWIAPSMRTTM